MWKQILIIGAVVLIFSSFIPMAGEGSLESRYKYFMEESFLKTYIPLYKEMAMSYWNASITGNIEDWQRVESSLKRINNYLSDTTIFQFLKHVRLSNITQNLSESRELEVIYLAYKGNQADVSILNEIANISSTIERFFNNYRTCWRGKNLTDNDVSEFLKNSTDSKLLEEIWVAQKRIGPFVADDILKLVKLRNQIAQNLGYLNYHTMSLSLSEQDPSEISKLFDILDEQTSSKFTSLKNDIDAFLARRYNASELQPWHYQDLFFQHPPKIYSMDYDQFYADLSLEDLTSEFFKSIDLPIDDLMKKSDLYSKPGKSQHAMCIDIDNEGDIRVLSNNVNNAKWMNTMLHEFGHAAYDKFISSELPFVLREPAHIFITEAVAMLFQRFAYNPLFIRKFEAKMPIIEEQKEIYREFALERLVFSRWAQVMYRFERQMYEDPEQDLNELWWKLVEKYQLLKKPHGRVEADWATKIHFSIAPCYYHNYMLGELLASQLNNYICKQIIKGHINLLKPDYYGKKEVGNYLKKKVFEPGKLYKWDEMIKRATGEQLSPHYYAAEIELCLNN